jgi:dTDP-4-dehydrorhamnose 3,5-epimerase
MWTGLARLPNVQTRELAIPDAWEFTPELHADSRGEFHESYRFEAVESVVGHSLRLKQVNVSVSARAVARGIHYALVPPGQAKYVTAPFGAFLDFVIDVREGSPTFGRWDSVVIDDVDHRAVYVGEGLGHAIVALTKRATVSYLISEVYQPARELALDIFDPEIGLKLPDNIGPLVRSEKDMMAPTLSRALAEGLLPSWTDSIALSRAQVR